MPHTPSAKRHLRKSSKQRMYNRSVKRTIKETLREVQEAAKAGKPDDLKKAVQLAAKKLDKAAARRTIHPNLASRKKGQLARLLQKKTAPAATARP